MSAGGTATVRVELPSPLCLLAKIPRDIDMVVEGPVTLRAVLDGLEARYPALRGTLRDHTTQERRPFLRFFACGLDLSHIAPDHALPEAVAEGREPLLIIGAIAGG